MAGVDKEEIYIKNSILIVWPSHSGADVRFLYYTLFSLINRGYIDLVCNKATIPHYTKDKLRNTPFVLFPAEQQNEIIRYLENISRKIDQLISFKREKIDTLKKYKQSLIYECVTGKREIV